MSEVNACITAKKVRKNVLTVLQRAEILELLDAGESIGKLAKTYEVSKSAISKIKQRKNKILATKNLLDENDGNLKKKRFVGTEGSALEKKLYSWFLQRRNMGYPVTGPILQKQALLFASRLECMRHFKASNGWLDNFKKRHGIKYLSIEGEKLFADPEAGNDYRQKLCNFMEDRDIQPQHIYNCDETGLYWRMIPDNTFVAQKEQCTDVCKKSQDRISVILCSNATGTHKLPIFLIDKYAKSRSFHNIKSLPVVYDHQPNSWVNKSLMLKWYTTVFLPEITKHHDLENNKHIKIILIMDNAPCHPSTEKFAEISSVCTIHHLPSNVTSLVQPMDQGIIEKFKKCYKHIMLTRLLARGQTQKSDNLYSLSLLDCVSFCSLAWNEVSKTDIRHCWTKLIPLKGGVDSNIENIDVPAVFSLIKRLLQTDNVTLKDTIDWLNFDVHEVGWPPRSEEDFLLDCYPDEHNEISDNLNDNLPEDNQSTAETGNNESNRQSLKKYLEASETLLQLCYRTEGFEELVESLQKCQQLIINKVVRGNEYVQTSV